MNWISPQMSLLFPKVPFFWWSLKHIIIRLAAYIPLIYQLYTSFFVLAFRGRQYATDSHLWKIHPQMVLRVGRDLLEKNSGWFFLEAKKAARFHLWFGFSTASNTFISGFEHEKTWFLYFCFQTKSRYCMVLDAVTVGFFFVKSGNKFQPGNMTPGISQKWGLFKLMKT